MKSDVKKVGTSNILIKYADDVDLLVPGTSDVDIVTEFNSVKVWATQNKMVINFLKTKEMVFRRPNPRNIIYQPLLDSIERVRVAKLLCVFVQSNFCCEEHVKYCQSAARVCI